MAHDVSDSEHVEIRLREDEELDFFTELALHEAERWIQAVTRKKFQYPDDFRKSLGNGILLCEVLNNIKPGAVKRINKLPGPIAGLDNVNVFLKACTQSFGLKDTQLFDPNDLEDLSHRAISDEDENLLKQEVDRRARNVAVTIYWLGRTVAGDNKVPSLDPSAFAALVHSHGNKHLISDESFKNDSWQQLESPEKDHSPIHKHIRDSSYDSLGSYEPESESSFDDLDGSMPVRSDMKGDMKRYGSQGSLSRDLRLSATSDTQFSDKNDSMYQSSPDLSQGSHAHTRSSSTDSAEGGYYGNHSRQSSGSTETYPTRLSSSSSSGRKTSTSAAVDPLQFVKVKGAKDLAKTAEKQIEIAKEVNKMRGIVDSGGGSLTEEPDWQSNFKNWKNKRRKSTPAFASVGEAEEEKEKEKEEKSERQVKTFGQIMADRSKRRSLGPMNFYPMEDDGFGFSGQASEPAVTQTHSNRTESTPKEKKSKKTEIAPWARDSSGEGDSQSDSETNNSHQSGDTDSVFSDKSTPSRILSDDDSWVKSSKTNSLQSANRASPVSKQARPVSGNFKRWETNVQESQKKDEKKKVDMPKGTANIRNITKAYEKKDKDATAEPVVRRRQEFSNRSSFERAGDKFDATPPWKSLDLSHKSYQFQTEKALSPTSPKALMPREQRYSWTPPKDSAPSQDKHSVSTSQRSRYLETSSPPKHSKSLTFGAVASKPAEKSPPPTAAKPIRDRIMQAKAMFEKVVEEEQQKQVVGKRRLSEKTDQKTAIENKPAVANSEDIQGLPNDTHNDSIRDISKEIETLDSNSVKDTASETVTKGDSNDDGNNRLENVLEGSSNADQLNYLSVHGIVSEVSVDTSESLEGNSGSNQNVVESRNSTGDYVDAIDIKSEKGHENESSENIDKSYVVTEMRDGNAEKRDASNKSSELFELQTGQDNDIAEFEINETDRSKDASEYTNDNEDTRETPAQLQPIDQEKEELSSNGIKNNKTVSTGDRFDEGNQTTTPNKKKYTEKTIKVSQKPNNQRGFGFTLSGGIEKKQPITVHRVSLGSGADINELEAKDEILSVNGHDVATLTLVQVQSIVDRSVRRGQIELQIKRVVDQEDEFDSGQEEDISPPPASLNNNSQLSDRGSYYAYPTADTTPAYSRPSPAREPIPDYSKPILEVSVSADNNRPSLMDQLVKEQQQQQQQQHEANNNVLKTAKDKDEEAQDTEVIEQMVEKFSFSSQSMPKVRGLPENTQKVVDMNGPPDETVTEERPTLQVAAYKGSMPRTETMTEERPTINMAVKTTETPEPSPVPMPRRRTPDRTGALKAEVASPPPPTPPKAEPPPLMKVEDNTEDSGFGPPAALLRWQKPRVKSEYRNPFPSTSLDEQLKASKRLSSTLPYGTKSPFSLEDDYSKDDSNLNKVTLDSDLSKSNSSLRNTYHFDDSQRIQEWQHKQEVERKPDPRPSHPPIELNIQREEHLTAQYAEPSRRLGQVAAPDLSDINVPSTQPAPLSPQEKFERDQDRIRRQYEEEKRLAKKAEKKKQEEEQKMLNSDKFLQSMEAQVIQTKQEAENLNNIEPIRPAATQPKFNTEPMTIRMPANSPGRQFLIDPRNQDDSKPDPAKPEYTFHVDLQGPKPPLRTLNQEPEMSQEELLERERQKIREEEHRKLEEEKQRWQQEQEWKLQQQQESLRQERERLQQEEERIAQEKAALEQRRHQEEQFTPQYQPSSYASPRSPPPALDPKHRDAKKAPPPTAPKPDKAMKARLTREDLLMMNRKPTPMTKRPEGMDENASKSENGASVREAPTKAELHSLNAVPKPKYHSSGAWIKDEEPEQEKPFVIGKRSDLIHSMDNSNSQEHWLVREAERRRISEQNNRRDYDSVTARAGPTKPSQSSLINRFRGDIEPPPRTNRYSYPSVQSSDSRLSSQQSRPLSSQFEKSPEKNVMQFSAKTSPNSYSNPSQTLPTNFSFNANLPVSRDSPAISSRPPRAPSDGTDAVIAVSGKQQCSHCGEELAGLKFSKV